MHRSADILDLEEIAINQLWHLVKSNTQQLVALMQVPENFDNTITQQPVAEIEDGLFSHSLIGRIMWSHHIVLSEEREYGVGFTLDFHFLPLGERQ
jgi:hypothetical protein